MNIHISTCGRSASLQKAPVWWWGDKAAPPFDMWSHVCPLKSRMIIAALALSLPREGKADAKQLSLVEILFRCSRHPQHDYLLVTLLNCAFNPCVNDSTSLHDFSTVYRVLPIILGTIAGLPYQLSQSHRDF